VKSDLEKVLESNFTNSAFNDLQENTAQKAVRFMLDQIVQDEALSSTILEQILMVSRHMKKSNKVLQFDDKNDIDNVLEAFGNSCHI